MKILHLSFRNLNSLAGDWNLDLTHPAYVSSGIFAITGPTGAGKTTILDAICLALYGQTPRLGRITQGENEIMSRQSGDCCAEVEFETGHGRFRCHWSQHRSRRRPDGQLQQPRHEICEAESGKILESKLKGVAMRVEEVTGMDFDRFTRSMLLAQGGFAAFLQARPDERAPILEQITGTAIYSRISIKVHERTAEERTRLTEMRAELEGIRLLSPEEEQELLLAKTERKQRESALDAEAGAIREALAWQERITLLQQELLRLDHEQQAFKERREAAAPRLEQLTLAGRALKLGGDHAHILLLRTQQQEELMELRTAMERLPRLQSQWQEAFEGLERADAGCAQARQTQEREAELIRLTRELDLRIGGLQAQLRDLAAETEATRRQASGYRLAMEGCHRRMTENGEELRHVAAFLEEQHADAGLVEAVTGIEQQLKGLGTTVRQHDEIRAALERQAGVLEDATHSFARAEEQWHKAQTAATEAEGRLAAIRGQRLVLLKGRELSAWRDESQSLAGRLTRLETIGQLLGRIEENGHRLTELRGRQHELEQRQQALTRREHSLAGECQLRERIVRELQDKLVLLNRVRSLEEDRKQLADGVACPLCGATHHPYATGTAPQPDQARQELETALEESARGGELLSRVRQEQVAVQKDLQRAGQDRVELEARLLDDRTIRDDASRELGISQEADQAANGQAWALIIDRETRACRDRLADRLAVIREGERQEGEERGAGELVERLKGELAARDQARLSARLGRESAQTERMRLEQQVAALGAQRDRALEEMGRVLAPFGIPEITPAGGDELLAALTGRRDAYVRHLRTRELLERGRAECAAEGEKQRALLAEAERALCDREQQLREMTAHRGALVEQRLERYGERDPDREEKRLADVLRQADKQREQALREQSRLQDELGGLKQRIEGMTTSCDHRGEELAQREAAFLARLHESGFSDEAAYLHACLSQERFDELTRWAEELIRDETSITTRLRDRQETLGRELERNLTAKPLEQIREEHAALASLLGELQKELGAIDQQLRQQAEQLQRHQSRLQAIQLQSSECERWERLRVLIGSSDGKKFRNFAQGLTFELMVAHANRQLSKMSDRYILVRDTTEPLELNVIDNYQAGEIRSTKNLSGGESFIVSLALSLGLSGMASRNVRVDSLFLDEGFGTLDEDALEMALETLAGLQQEGKLIGIISHVPALKERIGARIQVEAGSGGRSTLSGPGCQRVS
jgi:exonuclease SbcC